MEGEEDFSDWSNSWWGSYKYFEALKFYSSMTLSADTSSTSTNNSFCENMDYNRQNCVPFRSQNIQMFNTQFNNEQQPSFNNNAYYYDPSLHRNNYQNFRKPRSLAHRNYSHFSLPHQRSFQHDHRSAVPSPYGVNYTPYQNLSQQFPRSVHAPFRPPLPLPEKNTIKPPPPHSPYRSPSPNLSNTDKSIPNKPSTSSNDPVTSSTSKDSSQSPVDKQQKPSSPSPPQQVIVNISPNIKTVSCEEQCPAASSKVTETDKVNTDKTSAQCFPNVKVETSADVRSNNKIVDEAGIEEILDSDAETVKFEDEDNCEIEDIIDLTDSPQMLDEANNIMLVDETEKNKCEEIVNDGNNNNDVANVDHQLKEPEKENEEQSVEDIFSMLVTECDHLIQLDPKKTCKLEEDTDVKKSDQSADQTADAVSVQQTNSPPRSEDEVVSIKDDGSSKSQSATNTMDKHQQKKAATIAKIYGGMLERNKKNEGQVRRISISTVESLRLDEESQGSAPSSRRARSKSFDVSMSSIDDMRITRRTSIMYGVDCSAELPPISVSSLCNTNEKETNESVIHNNSKNCDGKTKKHSNKKRKHCEDQPKQKKHKSMVSQEAATRLKQLFGDDSEDESIYVQFKAKCLNQSYDSLDGTRIENDPDRADEKISVSRSHEKNKKERKKKKKNKLKKSKGIDTSLYNKLCSKSLVVKVCKSNEINEMLERRKKEMSSKNEKKRSLTECSSSNDDFAKKIRKSSNEESQDHGTINSANIAESLKYGTFNQLSEDEEFTKKIRKSSNEESQDHGTINSANIAESLKYGTFNQLSEDEEFAVELETDSPFKVKAQCSLNRKMLQGPCRVHVSSSEQDDRTDVNINIRVSVNTHQMDQNLIVKITDAPVSQTVVPNREQIATQNTIRPTNCVQKQLPQNQHKTQQSNTPSNPPTSKPSTSTTSQTDDHLGNQHKTQQSNTTSNPPTSKPSTSTTSQTDDYLGNQHKTQQSNTTSNPPTSKSSTSTTSQTDDYLGNQHKTQQSNTTSNPPASKPSSSTFSQTDDHTGNMTADEEFLEFMRTKQYRNLGPTSEGGDPHSKSSTKKKRHLRFRPTFTTLSDTETSITGSRWIEIMSFKLFFYFEAVRWGQDFIERKPHWMTMTHLRNEMPEIVNFPDLMMHRISNFAYKQLTPRKLIDFNLKTMIPSFHETLRNQYHFNLPLQQIYHILHKVMCRWEDIRSPLLRKLRDDIAFECNKKVHSYIRDPSIFSMLSEELEANISVTTNNTESPRQQSSSVPLVALDITSASENRRDDSRNVTSIENDVETRTSNNSGNEETEDTPSNSANIPIPSKSGQMNSILCGMSTLPERPKTLGNVQTNAIRQPEEPSKLPPPPPYWNPKVAHVAAPSFQHLAIAPVHNYQTSENSTVQNHLPSPDQPISHQASLPSSARQSAVNTPQQHHQNPVSSVATTRENNSIRINQALQNGNFQNQYLLTNLPRIDARLSNHYLSNVNSPLQQISTPMQAQGGFPYPSARPPTTTNQLMVNAMPHNAGNVSRPNQAVSLVNCTNNLPVVDNHGVRCKQTLLEQYQSQLASQDGGHLTRQMMINTQRNVVNMIPSPVIAYNTCNPLHTSCCRTNYDTNNSRFCLQSGTSTQQAASVNQQMAVAANKSPNVASNVFPTRNQSNNITPAPTANANPCTNQQNCGFQQYQQQQQQQLQKQLQQQQLQQQLQHQQQIHQLKQQQQQLQPQQQQQEAVTSPSAYRLQLKQQQQQQVQQQTVTSPSAYRLQLKQQQQQQQQQKKTPITSPSAYRLASLMRENAVTGAQSGNNANEQLLPPLSTIGISIEEPFAVQEQASQLANPSTLTQSMGTFMSSNGTLLEKEKQPGMFSAPTFTTISQNSPVQTNNASNNTQTGNTSTERDVCRTPLFNRTCICSKTASFMCHCEKAIYCSSQCQNKDWPNHKIVCLRED